MLNIVKSFSDVKKSSYYMFSSVEAFPNGLGQSKVVLICRLSCPGDFRSWESPQPLPALFIGPFEHVERFRNLKFAVIRTTNIQSTVLSSFEGTAAIHLAFK